MPSTSFSFVIADPEITPECLRELVRQMPGTPLTACFGPQIGVVQSAKIENGWITATANLQAAMDHTPHGFGIGYTVDPLQITEVSVLPERK